MVTPSTLGWFSLGILTHRRRAKLLEQYASLEQAWEKMDEEMLNALGCKPETIDRAMHLRSRFDASAIKKRIEARGIGLLTLGDAAYPALLQEIGDPPVFLSYRGDLSVLSRPCLGIVGTRAMTSYGKRVTEAFVPSFVVSGITTVSGLALGIDAAVARISMERGGATVAVLGSGIENVYPRSNGTLAEEIVEKGGLLLSEFPLDRAPDLYTFPARNRIIAGLSLGVLVIEAGEESGALITADLAIDYGREAFAVPGSVLSDESKGCHRIIARGEASIVCSPEEVLLGIGILAPIARDTHGSLPEDPLERRVWDRLSGVPISLSDLVESLDMGAAELGAILTNLELSSHAQCSRGMWVRGER